MYAKFHGMIGMRNGNESIYTFMKSFATNSGQTDYLCKLGKLLQTDRQFRQHMVTLQYLALGSGGEVI